MLESLRNYLETKEVIQSIEINPNFSGLRVGDKTTKVPVFVEQTVLEDNSNDISYQRRE